MAEGFITGQAGQPISGGTKYTTREELIEGDKVHLEFERSSVTDHPLMGETPSASTGSFFINCSEGLSFCVEVTSSGQLDVIAIKHISSFSTARSTFTPNGGMTNASAFKIIGLGRVSDDSIIIAYSIQFSYELACVVVKYSGTSFSQGSVHFTGIDSNGREVAVSETPAESGNIYVCALVESSSVTSHRLLTLQVNNVTISQQRNVVVTTTFDMQRLSISADRFTASANGVSTAGYVTFGSVSDSGFTEIHRSFNPISGNVFTSHSKIPATGFCHHVHYGANFATVKLYKGSALYHTETFHHSGITQVTVQTRNETRSIVSIFTASQGAYIYHFNLQNKDCRYSLGHILVPGLNKGLAVPIWSNYLMVAGVTTASNRKVDIILPEIVAKKSTTNRSPYLVIDGGNVGVMATLI